MKYSEISLKNVLFIILAAFLWFIFLYFQSTYKEQSYIKRVNAKYAKSEIAHMEKELEGFTRSATEVLLSTFKRSPQQIAVAERLLHFRYSFLRAVYLSSDGLIFVSGNDELFSEELLGSIEPKSSSFFTSWQGRKYLIISMAVQERNHIAFVVDPEELFETGIRFRKDMPLEVRTEDWEYISQQITEKRFFPIEYGYEAQLISNELVFQISLYPDKVLRYSRAVFWKNISLGIALFLLILIQFLGGGLFLLRKKLRVSVKENEEMIQRLSRIADRTFRVDVQGHVLWSSSINMEGDLLALLDEKGKRYFQEFVRTDSLVPYVNFTSKFTAFSGKLFQSHIHLARLETGKELEIIVAVNLVNGSMRDSNGDMSCEIRIEKIVSVMVDIFANFITMVELNMELLENGENKVEIRENIKHSLSKMRSKAESVRRTIATYEISRIKINLPTLVNKVVEDKRDALQKKNIVINCSAMSPVDVSLDPEYFLQAFATLLEIAVLNLGAFSERTEISIAIDKVGNCSGICIELPAWNAPIENYNELADLFSIEKSMKDEKDLLQATGLAFCRNLFRINGIRMEFERMSPSGLRIILKVTKDN